MFKMFKLKKKKDSEKWKSSHKPVSLRVLTYNVGALPAPDDPELMTSLLGLCDATSAHPDMVAVGLQEVGVDISEVLTDDFYDESWSKALIDLLQQYGYCAVRAGRVLGISLLVFVQKKMLLQVSGIELEITRTKLSTKGKGGVAIRFEMNGTSVALINSHLEAHLENVEERILDYHEIIRESKFKAKTSNILDHDYVVWFGDLNFRVDNIPMTTLLELVERRALDTLLKHDQLTKLRNKNKIFVGFQEAKITFPPTYKFKPGTDEYNPERRPSWTDRVLFSKRDVGRNDISASSYSHSDIKRSDHRPVTADLTFRVQLPKRGPDVDFRPVTSPVTSGREVTSEFVVQAWSHTSDDDWIGIFRSDFTHVRDHRGKVDASSAEKKEDKVYRVVLECDLTRQPAGEYYLGYFSDAARMLVGLSQPFTVVIAEREKAPSSRSSSEADSRRSSLRSNSPH